MDNRLAISLLAYKCAQNSASQNKEALAQNMQALKETLSTFELNEQYEIMAKLQNPNNVYGAKPAVEYEPVRDCFMSNLADYYSTQNKKDTTAEFQNQISVFTVDQLESLKGALITAQSEGFPANDQLNQNGINVTSERFIGYINQIDGMVADLNDDLSM